MNRSFLNRLRGGTLAVIAVPSLVVTLLGATTPAALAVDPAPGIATFEVGDCGEQFPDLYPVTLNYVNTSGVDHSLLIEVTRRYTDERALYGVYTVTEGEAVDQVMYLNDWLITGFPHGVILVTLTPKTSSNGSPSSSDLPGFSSITHTFNLSKCGSDPIPGSTTPPVSSVGKATAKVVKKKVVRHEVKLAVVRFNARELKGAGTTTFKVKVRRLNAGVARYRTEPVKVVNGRIKLVRFKHLKRHSKLVVRVKGKVIYRRTL